MASSSVKSNPAKPIKAWTTFGILRRIAPFLSWYRGTLISAVLLACGSAAAGQVFPLGVRVVVQQVSEMLARPKSTWNTDRLIAITLAVLIGASVVTAVFSYFERFIGEKVRYFLGRDLAQAAWEKRLSLETRQGGYEGGSEDKDTANVDQAINLGAEAIGRMVKNIIVDVLPVSLTALVSFVILWTYNHWFALIALFLFANSLLSVGQAKKQKGVRLALQQYRTARGERVIGAMKAIRIIQSYCRQTTEAELFRAANTRLAQQEIKHHWINQIFDAMKIFVEGAASTLLVIASVMLVLAGQIEVSGVTMAYLLFLNITAPVQQLHRIYDESQEAAALSSNYFGLLDARSEITSPSNPYQPVATNGRFEFIDVHFGYTDDTEVLHGVSLVIEPGKMTALVGISGAGKSTIANLLSRFFDPTQGRVLLDGRDLRDYDLGLLRSRIGLVPQNTYLLPGTIEYNVAYGTIDGHDSAANAVDVALNMAGFDVSDGARGITLATDAGRLSGGEKQRVAVARCFVKNPPILILDEPTSNLDVITARQVMESIERLRQNRTVLVISHRMAHFMSADQIYVIRDGHLVGAGSHSELYARGAKHCEHYAELVDMGRDVFGDDLPAPELSGSSPAPILVVGA